MLRCAAELRSLVAMGWLAAVLLRVWGGFADDGFARGGSEGVCCLRCSGAGETDGVNVVAGEMGGFGDGAVGG